MNKIYINSFMYLNYNFRIFDIEEKNKYNFLYIIY